VNRDGSAKNDILYIQGISEIKLQNIVDRNNVVLVSANEQLDAYIMITKFLLHRGQCGKKRKLTRRLGDHQCEHSPFIAVASWYGFGRGLRIN
jgi:hypothetical protein